MEAYSLAPAVMNEVKMNGNNESGKEMRNVSQVKRQRTGMGTNRLRFGLVKEKRF